MGKVKIDLTFILDEVNMLVPETLSMQLRRAIRLLNHDLKILEIQKCVYKRAYEKLKEKNNE